MCVAGFNLSDFNLSVSVSEYFRFSIFSIFQFVNGTSITIMIFHDACFKLTSRRSTSSLKYLVQVDLLR